MWLCDIAHMENTNNITRRNVALPVEIHKRLKNIATDNDTDLQKLMEVITTDFIKKIDSKVTHYTRIKNLLNIKD